MTNPNQQSRELQPAWYEHGWPAYFLDWTYPWHRKLAAAVIVSLVCFVILMLPFFWLLPGLLELFWTPGVPKEQASMMLSLAIGGAAQSAPLVLFPVVVAVLQSIWNAARKAMGRRKQQKLEGLAKIKVRRLEGIPLATFFGLYIASVAIFLVAFYIFSDQIVPLAAIPLTLFAIVFIVIRVIQEKCAREKQRILEQVDAETAE